MSARRKKVDALHYDSTFDDSCDDLFIGTVSIDSVQQSEDWKESVTINQKSIMFIDNLKSLVLLYGPV
jgi:hypothetical protein